MVNNYNLESLALVNGTQAIGDAQTGIAFSAVASGGTGLLNITAAAHGMTKGTQFSIDTGAYTGYFRVKKVISASIIQVEGTFGATATGTLNRKAALDGYGFYVDKVPLTVAELIPTSANFDVTGFLKTVFVAGRWYPCDYKRLKLSVGDITCIRRPVPGVLAYNNR